MRISLSKKRIKKKPEHMIQWEKAQKELAKKVKAQHKKDLEGMSGPEAELKKRSQDWKDELSAYMGKHKKKVDKQK